MKQQLLILACALQVGIQLQGMSFFRTDEENLLHYAEKGDYTKVEALLKKGINPNSVLTEKSDKWQKSLLTPLMLASKYNHPEIVDLLIQYKADPTLTNDFGMTALHLAAYKGSGEVIKQLITAPGVQVDARSHGNEMTPLMVAAERGHIKVAQELLDNGAFIDAQDEYNWTPLAHAANKNEFEMVEFLLNKGALARLGSIKLSLDEGGKWSDSGPLVLAVQYRNIKIAALLIKHGAPVNIHNNIKDFAMPSIGVPSTLLGWAIRGGNLKMVELLLENGADTSEKIYVDYYSPPLAAAEYAIKYNRRDVAKLIYAYENQKKSLAHEKGKKESEEKMQHISLPKKMEISEAAQTKIPSAVAEKKIISMITPASAPLEEEEEEFACPSFIGEQKKIETEPLAEKAKNIPAEIAMITPAPAPELEEAPPSYESLYPEPSAPAEELMSPILHEKESVQTPKKKVSKKQAVVLL